ncbi:MAG: DNA primase DnaG [archaeon]|nr:DNA primase DnaG [archaeon]
MGKTYIDTVKYRIVTTFEIKGTVDKNDIIGAVFGQSEGLLGADMDLKELQQNGKIGRIEVELKSENGVTTGKIFVPSSMDMVKTSILAAAVESIEKVGPAESMFKTIAIEDTRSTKRTEIKSRAKELLQKLMQDQLPETDILAEEVKEDVRTAEVENYGKEKLPAGPEVDSNNELIIVEGRADVINLLKYNIKNVIGMDGAKIPKTIIDLSKKKQITLFIDGDRGGALNARKLMQMATISFIARAPDGKEVEELQRKEVVMALRKRIPADKFAENPDATATEFSNTFEKGERETSSRDSPREFAPRNNFRENNFRERDSFRARESFNERPRDSGYDRPYSPRPRYGDRPSFRPRDSFQERGNFQRRDSYNDRATGFNNERRPYNDRPAFRPRDSFEQRDSFNERPRFDSRNSFNNERSFNPREERRSPIEESPFNETAMNVSDDDKKRFEPIMKELKGSLKAKLLSARNKALSTCAIRELSTELEKAKKVDAIVLDGIITKRLVDEAVKKEVKTIVGVKIAKFSIPKEIKVISIAS